MNDQPQFRLDTSMADRFPTERWPVYINGPHCFSATIPYRENYRELAAALVDGANASPVVLAEVKPLEWLLETGGAYNEAPTSIGTYGIMNRDGHWCWKYIPDGFWSHSDKSVSEVQVMDAAQSDYEIRARATLVVEYESLASIAAGDVIKERALQVAKEGWTTAHDDGHVGAEMARAAACYAEHSSQMAMASQDEYQNSDAHGTDHELGIYPWPWDRDYWKPKNPRRDLVRAGALILAEIERLDRADAAEGGENG